MSSASSFPNWSPISPVEADPKEYVSGPRLAAPSFSGLACFHIGPSLTTTMKLQQLPLGARFEWDGQVYVKTGPLTAASQSGGNRLIPRFAVLKPLGSDRPPVQKPADPAQQAWLEAFEAFYRSCQTLVEPHRHPELAQARLSFLAELDRAHKA